jgi:aryl-alcohol dehydrogenase-like predicted oxidoreductase
MPTDPLPTRRLGGLDVPAIGYGAMVLSPGMYGEIDDDRADTALRHAIEAGATFIDTSDGYGDDGHNETIVGRAISSRRDEVVVATKFGFNRPAGVEGHAFPVAYSFGELVVNNEPQHVRGYAEASLRRLGTDRIDLYYPHFPDPQVPLEDTVGAVGELVAAGLVRHLGLSNVDADQLRRAHATHPVTAVQVEWSMWEPAPGDLLAAAADLGVGIVAWSPLGGGFLTGTVTTVAEDDFRRNAPRFQGGNLAANRDRYSFLRDVAAALGVTPGQLALAWLLDQRPDVVPIPGSRTPHHIDENLAAAAITLDRPTLDELSRRLSAVEPTGAALLA